jgi:hypothetical protein
MFANFPYSTSASGSLLSISETPIERDDLFGSLEKRCRDTTSLAKKVVAAVRSSLEKAEQFKQTVSLERGM